MLASRVGGGCFATSTTIGFCCSHEHRQRRCSSLAPTTGTRERQLDERAHADAGRALRLIRLGLFRPRRAGDVEVHPRQIAGELLDEERAGDRAAGAAAGVGEVGDLALQLLLVVVEDRHRPRAIAGALARRRAPRSTHACGVPNSPLVVLPSATTHAPVSVASRRDAWRRAAARTRARRRARAGLRRRCSGSRPSCPPRSSGRRPA